MIGFRRHPAYRELSEFSDGTLERRGLARVSRHLERCPVCRTEVGTIRDADEAMRRVPVPPMPEGLLERVLERRDSGVRTLLPAAGPGGTKRRRRTPRLVAGITLIASLAIGVAVVSREASAGASSLEIGATAPATPLELHYDPGVALTGESEVRVRARIWRAGSPRSETRSVGTLVRAGNAFEGDASLPADAAFALIALEDRSGEHVDVNGGDFWEYVEGGHATPTPAARAARLDALEALAVDGLAPPADARIAAVSAALAAPHDFDLWDRRLSLELRATTDSARRAEMLDLHRDKLRVFEELADDPDDYAILVHYAANLVEPEARMRFLRRLEALDPRHEVVLEERLTDYLASLGSGDAMRLEDLEALWRDFGGDDAPPSDPLRYLASVALSSAYSDGDPGAIAHWARRFHRMDEGSRDGLVEDLSKREGLHALTIELARQRLDHYDGLSDDDRPLHQSRAEHAAVTANRRARLLAAMGRALLARGDTAEAFDRLEQSLGLAWDPSTATALLAGSTTIDERSHWNRRDLAMLLEADPLVGAAESSAFASHPEHSRDAREELTDLLMRGAPSGHIPETAFRSRVGREVPIDDGGVTVIALWQIVPESNHEDYRTLENLTPRLTESGIRVLFAVPEAILDDAVTFASDVGARPVVDDAGIAAEGFGNWYAHAYVVVHEGWYSVHYDFEEAARLALLRSEA